MPYLSGGVDSIISGGGGFSCCCFQAHFPSQGQEQKIPSSFWIPADKVVLSLEGLLLYANIKWWMFIAFGVCLEQFQTWCHFWLDLKLAILQVTQLLQIIWLYLRYWSWEQFPSEVKMNAVQLGFSIAARIQTSGEDVCEVLNISISATQKGICRYQKNIGWVSSSNFSLLFMFLNTLLQRCNW